MAGTFYSFCGKEIGTPLDKKNSKNSKNTTQRTTPTIWRIFAELNNPLPHKLAHQQATEDELNIDGGKPRFSLFLN